MLVIITVVTVVMNGFDKETCGKHGGGPGARIWEGLGGAGSAQGQEALAGWASLWAGEAGGHVTQVPM